MHLLRLLGNTPLQLDVEFLQTASHESRNVSKDHLDRFDHTLTDRSNPLVRGFDDHFRAPHSRYTGTDVSDVEHSELDVLAVSDEAGLYLAASPDLREVYITGHGEYSRETLDLEYRRDQQAGLQPSIPRHYYPADDPTQPPEIT